MFASILWKVFLWSGTRLFNAVDIYAPGNEEAEVVAVTFSNNDEYLVEVGKIELDS